MEYGNDRLPELYSRLKRYSQRIIQLYNALPRSGSEGVIGNQLLRSGTSPGAQYAEAQRAKSNKDFVGKIDGALQELEESRYWLELLCETGILPSKRVKPLIDETVELIKILITIAKRMRSRG